MNIIFAWCLCLWDLTSLVSLLLFTQPRTFLLSFIKIDLNTRPWVPVTWVQGVVGEQITLCWNLCSCIWQELEAWKIFPVPVIVLISKVGHWWFRFISNSGTCLPLLAFSFYCCFLCLLTFLGKHLPDICPAWLLDSYGFRAWALRNPTSYTNIGHFITCFHQLGPLFMKKQNKNKTQNFSKVVICLFLR